MEKISSRNTKKGRDLMQSIKVRFYTLGAALFTALGMALAAAFVPHSAPAPAPSAVLPASNGQAVAEPAYPYTVRDFNGKIAVYQASNTTVPQYITDFDTAALPQHDRDLLQKGIGLHSQEELQMLLEDYSS